MEVGFSTVLPRISGAAGERMCKNVHRPVVSWARRNEAESKKRQKDRKRLKLAKKTIFRLTVVIDQR